MLNEKQLEEVFESLGVPESGRRLINLIRNSPPARAVRGGPHNSCGYFASRKMGLTIQSESRHYEMAFVRLWEPDAEVLEYWDQPIKIKIYYTLKNGRNHAVSHTPDFFVIWKSKAGFVEVKTEAALAKLVVDQPGRYSRGDDGRWHSLPCERYAAEHGLGYWILTDSDLDRTYLRNIDFLASYFSLDPATLDDGECAFVRGRLAAKPATLLSELVDATLGAGIDADVVYGMIALDLIHVDLSAAALAEGDRVYVFINAAAAELYDPSVRLPDMSDASFISMAVGQSIMYGDRRADIVNITESEVWLCGEGKEAVVTLTHDQFDELFRSKKITGLKIQEPDGRKEEVLRILNETSPTDMEEALRRVDFVHRYLNGERFPADVIAPSTLHRYVANYRDGEARYGSGFVALIPDFHGRGNRNPRFPPEVRGIIDHWIEDYESPKQKSYSSSYKGLVKACEAAGHEPPSLPTFIKMVRARPIYAQVRARKGPKAAKSVAPFSRWLEKDTPRQGDRPFQICHVDHTKLDLSARCSRTGRNLGRPWVTFLSCAWSRILLAVYMTFDPPSYRSCQMVLRECVRRKARLPEYLVVDGGKEFKGLYFRALCAQYGIHLISREGKPRHGSTCERLFDTNRTQYANNMLGNTQIMKNVREVSKEVDPQVQGVWTLGAAYRRLREWAYTVYETSDHFTLKQSPREAFAAGLTRYGSRENTKITYDDVFRSLTLPTTPRGRAKVAHNCGVKINNIYYFHDDLRSPEVIGKYLPVRYDPFDMGHAYAYVNGRWVTGTSDHFWFFQGRTEREMQLAASEIRRRDKLLNRKRSMSGGLLAEFVESLEQEEKSLRANRILLQRSRDIELTGVHASINGGAPAPPELLQLPAGSGEGLPAGHAASEPAAPGGGEPDETIDELELMGELNW